MKAIFQKNLRDFTYLKIITYVAIVIFLYTFFLPRAVYAEVKVINTLALDNVWSGHRIKPYLLTRGEHQFVAYFDANRQMTVGYRALNGKWRYYKVDSWLGWDSHNYVTMELDKEGYLHVMGNMHADPLEYFRTSEPYNVRSLRRVAQLVTPEVEQRMTYPIFLLNKNNDLIVKYRDGGSGNGSEIYNIYNTESKTWSKLHNQQFLDGEGLMSGYFEGPRLGPDGYFHLIWVWRNSPNAATNHSLSYARSTDLVHWEDSNGQSISLPVTLKKAEIVAPVPPFAGMINGNVKLGFDSKNQPVITYHRYDPKGNTQMFLARKEGKGWINTQISDWKNFRWDFGGHGSLGRFAVRPYNPIALNDKEIGIMVRKHDQVMQFVVSQQTWETVRVEEAEIFPAIITPDSLKANQHMFSGEIKYKLEHQVFEGVGDLSPKGGQYYLSWYSQPGNRDKAHSTISPSSVMLLHEIKE
ncbi:BNR repeat-containing protein [Catenovulum maritimum]|uniref:BNR repeat-containing family member n=1 Tax=Catenovulum maritimum TaxID=1513271 RepID=A0A0J8GRI0_9ALTE|nr:BNR repeat-containing protein [Catenovulum maritimum]KMT63889.1 hypothetical protein XM47_17205 [Catenovulum maritimum]